MLFDISYYAQTKCSTSLPWPFNWVSGIKDRRTILTDYCIPDSDIAGRRHCSRHHLTVPHVRCSTFDCRSFASAGPTVWNSRQSSCWARPVSMESENPPVCLLSFRWQCVRGVFTYSRYTTVHLLTYLQIYQTYPNHNYVRKKLCSSPSTFSLLMRSLPA